MKIYARGYYRSRGTKPLAEAPLEENTDPDFFLPRLRKPHWDEMRKELAVRIKGEEGPTTHEYELVFTVDDLALMLLAAFQRQSKDETLGIYARAMADHIRQALTSKGGKKQRAHATKTRAR